MTEPRPQDIAALLAEASLPTQFTLVSLRGGGNNRVYRVDCGTSSALLKVYFRHPDDPRDRLGAEFSFCRFAWGAGLRCVPQPLAQNRAQNLGLYEFIGGHVPANSQATAAQVQQAIDFFLELNRHKVRPDADALPVVSEACFSIAEHLTCVEKRLDRLRQLDASTPLGREARDVVAAEFLPRWAQIRRQVAAGAQAANLPVDAAIDARDRCLSPSDFGFHNTLEVDGKLKFIDFEYAGWDDPAKTVCDFFCTPTIPVPPQYWDHVGAAVAAGLSDPGLHMARFAMLLPVYQMKWCCIMFNDFLSVGNQRRSFAADADDAMQRQARQLAKARAALANIKA